MGYLSTPLPTGPLNAQSLEPIAQQAVRHPDYNLIDSSGWKRYFGHRWFLAEHQASGQRLLLLFKCHQQAGQLFHTILDETMGPNEKDVPLRLLEKAAAGTNPQPGGYSPEFRRQAWEQNQQDSASQSLLQELKRRCLAGQTDLPIVLQPDSRTVTYVSARQRSKRRHAYRNPGNSTLYALRPQDLDPTATRQLLEQQQPAGRQPLSKGTFTLKF